MKFIGILLVIFSILIFLRPVFSQNGPGLPYTIWGNVKDENGEGINGADVKVYMGNNLLGSNVTYHDISTGDGTFMVTFNLGNLKNGDNVRLIISKDGYETKNLSVEINTMLPSKSVRDIILNKIKVVTNDEGEKKTPFLEFTSIILILLIVAVSKKLER